MSRYIDADELYQAIAPKCDGYAGAVAMNDTITRRELLHYIEGFPSAVIIEPSDCEKIKEMFNAKLSFSQFWRINNEAEE